MNCLSSSRVDAGHKAETVSTINSRGWPWVVATSGAVKDARGAITGVGGGTGMSALKAGGGGLNWIGVSGFGGGG